MGADKNSAYSSARVIGYAQKCEITAKKPSGLLAAASSHKGAEIKKSSRLVITLTIAAVVQLSYALSED